MAENVHFISSTDNEKDVPRICETCGITLPNIFAYAGHLESKEHIKGVMKKKYGAKYLEAKEKLNKKNGKEAESDKSETSGDEAEVYTCEICNKICTGAISYRLHLSGKKHQKNIKKEKVLKQLYQEKILPNGDVPVKDDSIINAIFTQNEYASSEILCKVCNKKCNGPAAFRQHNRSEAHKKKVALQNRLKEKSETSGGISDDADADDDDEDVIGCDVCNKKFSGPLSYEQHMQSASHSKQVQQAKCLSKFKDLLILPEDSSMIQCKDCNKSFTGVKPFRDHLKSTAHLKAKQKIDLLKSLQEKHPEISITKKLPDSDDSDEDTTIACTVCHVPFSGPESARDHLLSQKHKKAAREKKRLEKLSTLKTGKIDSNMQSKGAEPYDNDSSDSFDIIG